MRSIIGHGGNGIVLKGFQEELNRLVAVKVMAPQLATSAAARKRFAREAQATAAIVHPNVMPILTVNSSGQLPFIVMPYVDCESLQDRLDRMGSLPVVDILRIGLQVAKGLAAAHAQGLVHRDVKPANILLERGVDRVMLTDFGLARAVDDATLTRTGLIAGTPQYMSPEQARGEAVDTRSDLFSLGSVLYALATGRPPFRAETSYGILRRVTDHEARSIRELNSEIPDWLEGIVNKLLAKSPDDRFSSSESVAELLEDCVAHVQQPNANALPDGVRSLVPASRRMLHRWPWLMAVLVVIAAAVGIQWLEGVGAKNEQNSGAAASVASTQPASEDGESKDDSSKVVAASDGTDDWNPAIEAELNELDSELDAVMQSLENME
ncbi:MAG: serine/threonine-protein kinase [Planctomycetaceae bacterium]